MDIIYTIKRWPWVPDWLALRWRFLRRQVEVSRRVTVTYNGQVISGDSIEPGDFIYLDDDGKPHKYE